MSKTSKPVSAPLSLFQQLNNKWNEDLTRAWVKIQAYGSVLAVAVIEGIQTLSGFVNNDTFKSYLDVLHVPQWVPGVLAILGIIAYLTLPSKDTDA